jgi:hypothetical protein
MHKPDKENLYCTTCGTHFNTIHKLMRHIQKWNGKHGLQSAILNRR